MYNDSERGGERHIAHLQKGDSFAAEMSPASSPTLQLTRKRRRSSSSDNDSSEESPTGNSTSSPSSDEESHRDDGAPYGEAPTADYFDFSDSSSDEELRRNVVAPHDAPRASRASSTPPPGLDVIILPSCKPRRRRRKLSPKSWIATTHKCYVPRNKTASPRSTDIGRLLDMNEDRSRVVAIRSQRSATASPRNSRLQHAPQHALQRVTANTQRTPDHNSNNT